MPKLSLCWRRPAALACILVVAGSARAATPGAQEDDAWPRFGGPRGDATWRGPRLSSTWPDGSLALKWRQPLGGGFGGISVSDGRAYVMDRQTEPEEQERLVCFDAATGKRLWAHAYPVRYGNLEYGNGPRATPMIARGRVYTFGALGHLHCVEADTGQVVWSKDLAADAGAQPPTWGLAASPVMFEDLVIVHPGLPGGSFVAFDAVTGEERWRSLDDPAGYATPVIVSRPGGVQLIVWTPLHVASLDPRSGKVHWRVPYNVNFGVSIATPIVHRNIVVASGYWEGTKAIKLGKLPADAQLVWEDKRHLRGLMSQPLCRDGFIFLLDKQHGLTCFDVVNGKKLWDDDNRATKRAHSPQATFVWLTGQGQRALILNADGELILASLTSRGYDEHARAKLIAPTETNLIWAYPAYAGDSVLSRSDREIVCGRLPTEQ